MIGDNGISTAYLNQIEAVTIARPYQGRALDSLPPNMLLSAAVMRAVLLVQGQETDLPEALGHPQHRHTGKLTACLQMSLWSGCF